MRGGDSSESTILIVDDHPPNVAVLEQMLEQWGYCKLITTTESGEALQLYLDSQPDLVLLDLVMPPPNGFEIMMAIRELNNGQTYLPILALTADATDEVRARALQAGANDFLTKPFDATELRLRVANLLETRRLYRCLETQNESLEQLIDERTRSLERARLEVLDRLSLAAEYRDDDTNEHAQRVGRTAARLARILGLPSGHVELIRRAAPLHDIGKIGIPDAILLKPDRLTASEYQLMQNHVEIGCRILSGSTSPVLTLAEEIVRTHHERWNGEGYLAGLAGEDIPLGGRLVALADVFDALTHRRPYKQALSIEAALPEIQALAGTHFDPHIVEAFQELDPHDLLTPVESTHTPRDS